MKLLQLNQLYNSEKGKNRYQSDIQTHQTKIEKDQKTNNDTLNTNYKLNTEDHEP